MKNKIIGVTLGMDGKPTLAFDDGTVSFPGAERRFYPEYFPGDCEWPRDPYTGNNLPSAPMSWYIHPVVKQVAFLDRLRGIFQPWRQKHS
jgi:hypothetical protein